MHERCMSLDLRYLRTDATEDTTEDTTEERSIRRAFG
jgi:hypothetical protein